MKGNQSKRIACFLAVILFGCDGVRVAAEEEVVVAVPDVDSIRWQNAHRETFNYLQALDLIKSGDVDKAVELLEYNLDLTVIRVWRLRENLSKEEQDTVSKVLGFVQIHRNQYPRKVDPDVELLEIRRNTYQKAKQMLDMSVEVGVTSGNRPVRIQGDTNVDDVQDRIDAVGVDGVYEELKFTYDRYVLIRDWNRAERTLKRIVDVIRNPDDDRHIQSSRRLKEIQETGSSTILGR